MFRKKHAYFFVAAELNRTDMVIGTIFIWVLINAIIIFSNKTLIENQMSKCVSEANLPICDGPDNLQQISFYEVNSTT